MSTQIQIAPKSFVELYYIDMTEEQKIIFDTFIEMIKSK